MGRAYGAPRLQATEVDARGTSALPAPLQLRSEPAESHEWRLVRLQGAIDSVHKLGDRWRAEVRVGGKLVVIVGQAGAGVPVETMAEGRTATITGIVRRPYPTASDQRFTILPRSPADIRVTGAASGDAPAASGGAAAGPGGASASTGASSRPLPAGRDIDLADLASAAGEQVRVGGIVTELLPNGVRIDDRTASGLVVLAGDALELLPLIELDDAINASGIVETVAGELVIKVSDPAGLALAADPTAVDVTSPSAPNDVVRGAGAIPTEAGFTDPPGGLPGAAGLGTLLAVSLVSLGVTGLRRWQARRRLGLRVAARLAAIAGGGMAAIDGLGEPLPAPPAAAPAGPRGGPDPGLLGSRSAEHESRTRGSA
jgi:hypothetical protein